MEDHQQTLALLLHACNLARHLESNLLLPHTNPETISKSCDDIIAVFLACKERLSLSSPAAAETQQGLFGHPPWLMKCNTAPAAMEMFQAADQVATMTEVSTAAGPSSSSGGARLGGGGDVRTVASSSSTATQPRPRRRGYFRCTHQKLYNCRAKKQVQRLDHDPDTYEVTYRGRHTCHMSATAPSVGPPPTEEPHVAATSALQQVITAAAQQQQSTARWALEFRLGGGGGGGGRDHHHHQVDFPVSDMAAAMFNSGSSSTNASMDLIFNAAMDVHDEQDKQQFDDRGKGKE
ncbi:WRKY transcription factor 55 [Linum grandiflorum]